MPSARSDLRGSFERALAGVFPRNREPLAIMGRPQPCRSSAPGLRMGMVRSARIAGVAEERMPDRRVDSGPGCGRFRAGGRVGAASSLGRGPPAERRGRSIVVVGPAPCEAEQAVNCRMSQCGIRWSSACVSFPTKLSCLLLFIVGRVAVVAWRADQLSEDSGPSRGSAFAWVPLALL